MSLLSPIEVPVPDGARGRWRIESFNVSEQDASLSRVRAWAGDGDPVPAGRYQRLLRGGVVVMSTTPMEVRTHRQLFLAASRLGGHVLINGLGLGMALTRLLAIEGVSRVTVIEQSADVLALVAPAFGADVHRIEFVEADAFEYQPPRGARYSCVWHDIWDAPYRSNVDEMRTLKRKYAKRAQWQGCWAEDESKEARY